MKESLKNLINKKFQKPSNNVKKKSVEPNLTKESNTIPESKSNEANWINFQNIFSFLSVIVAIGAYSNSSLIVAILTKKDTYSVVRSTIISPNPITSQVATGFYRKYLTGLGDKLAPIQMLISINVRNNSENDQIIQGLKVEVKQNDIWNPVTCLPGDGIYACLGGLDKGILLDFSGRTLIDNLGKELLKPKALVSGWLFLYFDPKYGDNDITADNLRVTIYSGFGENEQHILKKIDIGQDSYGTNFSSSFRRVNDKTEDLSKLETLSEIDLQQKFIQLRRDSTLQKP